MKISLSQCNFSALKTLLQEGISRFPLASLSIFFTTALLFAFVHFDNSGTENFQSIIFEWTLASIITFFFSVALSFTFEAYNPKILYKILVQVISLGVGYAFYFVLDTFGIYNPLIFSYVFLSFLCVLAFLFISPFIRQILQGKGDQLSFTRFFYQIGSVFLTSFIIGFALTLLGFIGISATFTLFNLSFLDDSRIFYYWWVLSCSLIAPFYGLLHLPKVRVVAKGLGEENKFYKLLIRFIGIPFILFYFIILYAYSFKVLLDFGAWPNGQIAWMVIGFSFFGYFLYIASYVFAQKGTLIALFRKYFPLVVLPQTAMLFYSIYLRIAQYDFTVNRYFVVVFGIWLLIVSFYFVVSKKRYLGIIPLSLVVFVFIISIGPWSVYQFPQSRQIQALYTHLRIAGILGDDDVITPLRNYADIDAELSEKIYGEILYLCTYSDCSEVKNIFKNQISSEGGVIENTSRGENWNTVTTVTKAIKVQTKEERDQEKLSRYYYIDTSYQETLLPISVEGYDILTQLYASGSVNKDKDEFFTIVDVESETFSLFAKDVKIETISLSSEFNSLRKKMRENPNQTMPSESLIFDVKGEKYDIKILFDRLSIKKERRLAEGKKEYDFVSVSGYALIKTKGL